MSRGPHVVSGGASGIGLATVHLLRARGEDVVVIDRVPQPDALAGSGVTYVQQDVTDLDGTAAAIDLLLETFPSVRSVVASAGLGLSQHFETTAVREWTAVIDTNITGTIALVQGLVPALTREAEAWGNADVLTIGSVVDENSYAGSTIYGVSSAALKIFATHLRGELRERRIRVANLAPGYVRSPWAQRLTLTSDDYQRLGPDLVTVDDVASIIDYVLHQPPGVVVHDLVVVSTKQGWG
jgi:NADP-dependent 3-hydroxy acid dehydrogenase YdfG